MCEKQAVLGKNCHSETMKECPLETCGHGAQHETAVKLAPQFLTTNFKIEGVIDEQAGKLKEEFFKTPP
jgi:hypothetical protein